jgi:hypothetical protein
VVKGEKRLPLLGLVMIVRDEAEHLPRCLESVKPLIGSWTICDTGSTDNTVDVIREHLDGIPGRLYRHKWRDYGHNRTLARARAKGTARWTLMLDADMEVTYVWGGWRKWLAGRGKEPAALQVDIDYNGMNAPLPLLVRGDLDWRYVGASHEYLDPQGRTHMPLRGLKITHHDTKTPEQARARLERDIELLRPAFKKMDPRAIFYTAQSHRLLGNLIQAAAIYDLRASLNGFEEEVWYARFQAANCRQNIAELLEVWHEREWRCEPLLAAARIVARVEGAGDVLFLERPG